MARETEEYILGADPEELERLRFQHFAWLERGLDLWSRAGIRAGGRVLDLGCGPGFTSFELARVVGPSGRVIARDRSARFLAFLDAERQRLGLTWIETSLGPVEELALEGANLDAAYARWLLCWLPNPAAAVVRTAAALRPGGVLALQDYLDWAAMKMVPASPLFDRAVAACMRSWAQGGGTIDVIGRLPELARAANLILEDVRPIARLGAPGTLEWRWIGEFFASYLPKLVARGDFGPAELTDFGALWHERSADPSSRVLAPLVADAVLRKR